MKSNKLKPNSIKHCQKKVKLSIRLQKQFIHKYYIKIHKHANKKVGDKSYSMLTEIFFIS